MQKGPAKTVFIRLTGNKVTGGAHGCGPVKKPAGRPNRKGISMTIRVATQKDVPALCRLYNEFFAYNANQQPPYYKTAAETGAYPQSVIENPKEDLLCVVNSDDTPVGLAHVMEQQTPPYDCFIPHKYAFVMDLFVTAAFRGRGAGAALLGAAKQWAAARGLDYLELNVLAENTAAFRFYQREGFETVSQTMRLTL